MYVRSKRDYSALQKPFNLTGYIPRNCNWLASHPHLTEVFLKERKHYVMCYHEVCTHIATHNRHKLVFVLTDIYYKNNLQCYVSLVDVFHQV